MTEETIITKQQAEDLNKHGIVVTRVNHGITEWGQVYLQGLAETTDLDDADYEINDSDQDLDTTFEVTYKNKKTGKDTDITGLKTVQGLRKALETALADTE